METNDPPLDVLERIITELFIAEIVADPEIRTEMLKIQPVDIEKN